jgi:hypothetical protein
MSEPKFKNGDFIVSTTKNDEEKYTFLFVKEVVDKDNYKVMNDTNEDSIVKIDEIDSTYEKQVDGKTYSGGQSVVVASAKQDALPRSQKKLAKIVINENKNYKMRSIFNIYLT